MEISYQIVLIILVIVIVAFCYILFNLRNKIKRSENIINDYKTEQSKNKNEILTLKHHVDKIEQGVFFVVAKDKEVKELQNQIHFLNLIQKLDRPVIQDTHSKKYENLIADYKERLNQKEIHITKLEKRLNRLQNKNLYKATSERLEHENNEQKKKIIQLERNLEVKRNEINRLEKILKNMKEN